METRTVEQVEGWDSRSFSGGYDRLRQLSEREFSGAIEARGAWMFMLNGRIIGIYEGSLESFEDASGTAYNAPHPSLPLLFSMREQGGETQAKYYTNDTALSEADSTLKSGNFTGFIELSENVLSGDYYVAYYGGRAMSVAFVGASEQVITGDDAFQRANDEVGIYEVRNVDLEITDLPEPEEPEEPEPEQTESASSAGAAGAAGAGAGASAGAGAAGAAGQASGTSEPSESNQSTATEATTEATGDYEAFDPSAETTADTAAQSEPDPTSEAGNSADSATHERGAEANAPPAEPAADTPERPKAGQSSAEEPSTTPDESSSAQSASESPAQASQTTETATETAPEPTTETTPEPTTETTSEPETTTPETPTESNEDSSAEEATAAASAAATEESDAEGGAFDEEEEWRETTTIPSLNPDRSESQSKSSGGAAGASAGAVAGTTERADTSGRSTSAAESPSRKSGGSGDQSARNSSGRSSRSQSSRSQSARASSGNSQRQSSTNARSAQSDSASSDRQSQSDERTKQLRSNLRQSQQQVEQLEQRVSTVESERDDLKRECDTLRQEVERLESKLEAAQQGSGASAGTQLTTVDAFEGTNLFVRYQSKGKATLEEAAKGDADPDDVNANLQLEHHTQFEADDVAVDGESFEEFLTNSFEYKFASWVVQNLLYEIRDTGHRGSLKDLYDAIPKVDRVDFHGSVSASEDEDGTRQESFDVIMRDRMGNPLVAADLNASRDPTTGDMMGSLVDASTGVAEAHPELAGAFQVTASFFEPAALETAENATSGGFLSREKRESFIKLSRKRGFHLCLVESRSGGFHLNVPEL